MALTKEKLARQRALRANGNSNEALKRDVELHAASSARAAAEDKIAEAEAARNVIRNELKEAQKEYSDRDRASFGGRFKDMKLQGDIAAIEWRLEKAQNNYVNALAVLDKVEHDAQSARIQYYKHKSGAEYLESLGRKKRIEQALSRLEPLKDDPEIAPIIVEKEAQLRGIDNLHLAALQEYKDVFYLLTGEDIEQAPEPTEEELNPKPEVNPNLHGRARDSRRLDVSGAYQ